MRTLATTIAMLYYYGLNLQPQHAAAFYVIIAVWVLLACGAMLGDLYGIAGKLKQLRTRK